MRAIAKATATILALASIAGPTFADDIVKITWRKAQVISFGSGVGGIVIGDPSIVDITVQPNGQLVVFGKAPGETNLIVTGSDSVVLFNAPIVVMPEDNRQVSIINAGANTISERSWTCLSRCVQVLGPGGTTYSSVQAQSGGGTYGNLGKALDDAQAQREDDAKKAADDVANGVSDANAATGKGAATVAGSGGLTVVP